MTEDRVRMRLRHGDREIEVEGPRAYVEEKVLAWDEGWARASQRMEPAAELGAPVPGPGSGMRIKQYVAAKGPSGHAETATVLAMWAKRTESKEEISGEELAEYYKLAGVKRPADPVNVMAQASSKFGWFKNVGAGKYRITSAGEDHVNIDLGKKS